MLFRSANLKDLVNAFKHSSCKVNSNGAGFMGCNSEGLPDFSLDINGCKLSKTGDSIILTKGADSRTAKWNGGTMPFDADGMSESQVGDLFGVTLIAADNDLPNKSSTQIQLTVRLDTYASTSLLATFAKTGEKMQQVLCNP